MYKDSHKQLTFVMYDGIDNSVFGSMVLAPLLEMLAFSRNLEITLVSFESTQPSAKQLIERIPAHDNLHVVILRKLPFIGKFSLWIGIWQLYSLLKKIPSHDIIARGPLAGWIVTKALAKMAYKFPERLRKDARDKLPTVTIQARGLCAEEYRYSHMQKKESFIKRVCHRWMYNALKQIEYEVYRSKRKTDYPNDVTIQAVSTALKEYLVKNFRADETKIVIATHDLVRSIAPGQVSEWREVLRKQLGIMRDAYVYCYSGSYKPWQCADETIQFFGEQHAKDDKTFLLILTPDKDAFVDALERYNIPKNRSMVLSVTPQDLVRHLAVADAGLLFREADVINWVSRPTKMLEYQSVGLKVIHNNTVAWLCSGDGA